MITLVSFFHALSPLHAGVGQGIGTIDLPIAREKSTNIPFVPGSSLKGVLRDRCKGEPEVQKALFGPDVQKASDFSGSVYFSDLTLLCLPIRSLQRVFAWVTSPYILRRFQRDLAEVTNIKGLKVPSVEKQQALTAGQDLTLDNKVYLEELDLNAKSDQDARKWAEEIGKLVFADEEEWHKAFQTQFCIVHDDIYSYFLEHGTEVTARIRLEDDTKTVAKGGLWYEEALPVESLLWGLIQVDTPRGGKLDIDSTTELRKLVDKPLQLGGKATVGRGFGWLRLKGGKA